MSKHELHNKKNLHDRHSETGFCFCPNNKIMPDRRDFLKAAGLGVAGISGLTGRSSLLECLASIPEGNHHIFPPQKNLSKKWIQKLFDRGKPRIRRGKELDTIGMPIGGIASGQLYLCGDGTLGCWQIFNRWNFAGHGERSYSYRTRTSPVAQGFAVVIDNNSQMIARTLDRKSYPNAEFLGQYPIGKVRYPANGFPVEVNMEAFSPFIPLNAKDSSLPATIFRITVENTSDRPLQASILGWLENRVCHYTAPNIQGLKRSRIIRAKERTQLLHTVESMPRKQKSKLRPNVILANFESDDYGNWKVEGDAFGLRPVSATDSTRPIRKDFKGKGLVDTYISGDKSQGKLISPTFVITRKYINFLMGGGAHPDLTGINMIIDGKVVRSATGFRSDRLSWYSWNVEDFEGRKAQLEIIDQTSSRSWGHILVDQIELSDEPAPIKQLDDFGSMVLALNESAASLQQTRDLLKILGKLNLSLDAGEDLVWPIAEKRVPALASPMVELAPKAKRTFVFVLSWYFPNRSTHNKKIDLQTGHAYASRFTDAADIADYVLDNHDRLFSDTYTWHDCYYNSTLPYWLLERVHSTVSNLASDTCQWWKSGRFWTWEGVGCCQGTCTHVWNYAHALARLFPELERAVREIQDLDHALHPNGLVSYRGDRNSSYGYAADGQLGTVLKCYREHQMSADNIFLKRNWPRIKKVLAYATQQDPDEDGLIKNEQPNTFDINFYGPNTFVGSLYLAALRAGEEMAQEMGDADLARRLRGLFTRGSRESIKLLWNGEYFIQAVDLKKHPEHQYGRGCLSDQLFGQCWARQLGLDYIYPRDYVLKALQSIWKYNWFQNTGPYNKAHKPGRVFAKPGEAGLFNCTWPLSDHLEAGVLYRNEVWTGVEYQVAAHMITEGMLTEGLAIVRGVDERYLPLKRNPYNEVECGDHYVRALASWSVFTSLSGYEYHGPKAHLGFSPRITPDHFRSAFTTAEGWGRFSQLRKSDVQTGRIEIFWGILRLKTLTFSVPEDWTIEKMDVLVNTLPAKESIYSVKDTRIVVILAKPIVLKAGDSIEIVFNKKHNE